MNTKYNIGDKVLIEATVKAIRVYENSGIEYYLESDTGGFGASIEEKNIYGPSEAKDTSFEEYLDEQMKDPEFRKEYKKAEKETFYPVVNYHITDRFKIELSNAVYRKGEPACVISKTLGLPSNCITKIINGYTKRMTKERHDWICTALGIDPEV